MNEKFEIIKRKYQKISENIENIRKSISGFPWERVSPDSDVNKKVYLFK